MMLRRLSRMILLGLLAIASAAIAAIARGAENSVSFELDVQPIFTARGCNQGACHGKARGQNGFQLSLLGFDSEFDFAAITRQSRGRRVSPAAPEQSLLLRKATGTIAHGGGVRIDPSGDDYRVLLRWIATGMPRSLPNEPKLERVEVTPREQHLQPAGEQALKVIAFYSDGSQRDVTARAAFQSSEAAIVDVSRSGLMKAGPLPGEATVMVRYMSQLATSHVTIPLAGKVPDEEYARLPRANFIDDLVYAKLKTLGLTPSAGCDDLKFLRRVHLDLIGRLPTPNEVRAYLADANPKKRQALVDALLERPEYAEHWSGKWADLLRPNPFRVGIKAVVTYDAWIRDSFRKNKPYDQFVRELITASGSTWDNGAAVLFRDRREPEEITPLVSQLFLGVRLECAKCHHHPFEKWGQEDFYSFAAYFAKLDQKGTGLSPPISGGEEIIHHGSKGKVTHPLTGEVLSPRPLFGSAKEIATDDDPRDSLAAWVTSPENPYFTQVLVNRVWADLMGRGLVEPVDDIRATNPATNEPLLKALADDFRQSGYNIKHLLRTITTSNVYALSSLPNDRNTGDRQNYSRHYRTRPRGEVLLDALADITGVTEKFEGMPAGSRAKELWTARIDSLFLDTFSRPNPNQDPPCERTAETTVTQTLHLMNAPELHRRATSDSGRAARLAASQLTPDQIVEEVYLLVYSRPPDEEERKIGLQLFGEPGATRRTATEDLMWGLVNTAEFIYQD